MTYIIGMGRGFLALERALHDYSNLQPRLNKLTAMVGVEVYKDALYHLTAIQRMQIHSVSPLNALPTISYYGTEIMLDRAGNHNDQWAVYEDSGPTEGWDRFKHLLKKTADSEFRHLLEADPFDPWPAEAFLEPVKLVGWSGVMQASNPYLIATIT
jgi:hypothetical protein